MFRLFIYLLIVLGLAVLFMWAANNPGTVFIQWDWLSQKLTGVPGQEIGLPLLLIVVVLIILIFVVLFIASIFRGVASTPSFLSNFFATRRRDKGYKALSKGLIAASSGDVDMARSYSKESNKLLKNEPLVALLSTQTALLDGKRDEARMNYQKMLEHDDTKMVALRGLFLEAEKQGEPTAARHYAEEAVKLAPSLPWAGNAKLRYQAGDQDWDAALKSLDANRSAGLIDKITAKRQKAVLLTAKALQIEATDPKDAKALAKQAHKLATDLVPAAVTFARTSTRLGEIRGVPKILEVTWKLAPHPDIAEAYAHIRSGDSVQDRYKRTKKLASLKPNHEESGLALAIASIDAKKWEEAREALKPIITSAPTERACLLMADIEEGQHGDKGRMRDWLSRAVRAKADPTWVADGHSSAQWLPVSPISGEIDAFEWKIPVAVLGAVEAPVLSIEEFDLEAQMPEEEIVEIKEIEAVETLEVIEESSEEIKKSDEEASAEVEDKSDDKTEALEENEIITIASKPDDETSGEEEPKETAEAEAENSKKAPVKKAAPKKNAKKEENKIETVKFPLEKRPDDPGVHPDKVPPKKKGLGLF